MYTFLTLVILATIVYATNVKLEVSQKLLAELHNLDYEKYIENKPLKLNFIFVNAGNVPYKAKARLDIFKDSSHVFTGWSEEIPFNIGTEKNIKIYWYPQNTTGRFRGLLKVYYTTEMIDDGSIEFEVKNTKSPDETIQLLNLETYDNEMVLTVKSDRDIENIIIIPKNYPIGWFVSQNNIEKLEKNEKMKVKILYDPSLWEPDNKITFQVITEDGKYFGESSFIINKEGKMKTFIHYSIEQIKRFFENL